MTRKEEDFIKDLGDMLESTAPSGYLDTLDRERPYDGQPWTAHGERGKTLVHGVTQRDIRDCFIRACFDSSGLAPGDYPKSVHDLDWNDISPIAVAQNLLCWIEKYMGDFPNIPEDLDVWKDVPTIEMPMPDEEL